MLNTEQQPSYRVVRWTFECGSDKWDKWYVMFDGNVVAKHQTYGAAEEDARYRNTENKSLTTTF